MAGEVDDVLGLYPVQDEQDGQDGQHLQDFLRQISQKPATSRSFSTLISAPPARLEWDFSVMANRKHILSRMTGRARPGEVCCILGGSGAGKSTLLNVLACSVFFIFHSSISGKRPLYLVGTILRENENNCSIFSAQNNLINFYAFDIRLFKITYM